MLDGIMESWNHGKRKEKREKCSGGWGWGWGLFGPRLEAFDARARPAISKAEEKGIKIKIKMDQNWCVYSSIWLAVFMKSYGLRRSMGIMGC